MTTEEQIYDLVWQKDPANPLAYVRDIVRPLSFDRLWICIKNCTDCPIHVYGKAMPYGSPYAPILVIKEPAAKTYDKTLPEDEMLRKTFEFYGLTMDKLLWMNAIQCQPKEQLAGKTIKRAPGQRELERCRTFISFAVQSFAPVFIFLFGTPAVHSFWNATVEQVHGRVLTVNSIPVMATYSTTYLRSLQATMPDTYDVYKDIFLQDMKTAHDFLAVKYPALYQKE